MAHESSNGRRQARYYLLELKREVIPLGAVGIAGGLVGFFYLSLLKILSNTLNAPNLEHSIWHVLIMIAVGLMIPIIIHWFGSPGTVELLVNNIHLQGEGQDIKSLSSLIPISLLCIASGGAAGPEAPLVQTTGALGSYLANRFGIPLERRRILTITGMAAGFAVLFGAPLGAAIFSLEILHRRGLEYYEALLPALIGALLGYALYLITSGMGIAPVWHFPALGTIHHLDLLWAFLSGLIGAGIAILFTFVTIRLGHLMKLIPTWARSAIGGAGLGLLAFLSPYVLTYGESQVTSIALAPTAFGLFAIAAIAKFCGTTLTVSSGWKGGFIIPLFFIGVAMGRLFHILIPESNEVVLMAAFMTAINTGVTKTPLGSTLVVTKMAGIQLLPTTLIAGLVALFASGPAGLIETQRTRAKSKVLFADGSSMADSEPERSHS